MTLHVTPFDYNPILYQEAIDYLETKWERRLTDHEKNVLIEGYKIGRTVQVLDQWTKENEQSI